MYKLEFDWKEFNLSLDDVNAWMKANAGEHYSGLQGAVKLECWFREEPSQEIKDAVAAYIDGIDEHSDEAAAYKPMDEVLSEQQVLKASAKAKFMALGLSEAEANAIVG